jgi:hypothetical protein
MAVDRTSLITRFPEFAAADSNLVTACIADAELMVDRVYFGDKADMAVTHYAAHLIAINPLGEMARLDKKGDKTTYLLSFTAIKRSIGTGFRVI